MKNKKKLCSIAILGCLFISGLMLTGCEMFEDNPQGEVASALTNQDEPEQKTDDIEPESALEYVEIEEPDKNAMTDDALDSAVHTEVSEADETGNVESSVAMDGLEEEEDTLQIVFLGDSIFDAVRDDTGIAHQVGAQLGADIYNLSIGGTTAGLRRDKSTDKATWNEPNFLGVAYTMCGEVNNGLLDGTKSGEVMKTLDPAKTDYFIIEYGTNDFLWYIPLGAADYNGQYYFYFRPSLDLGIELLQKKYPDAKIIMCTPYYEEFWSADKTRFIGDANTTNNGYGTLLDYISVVKDAARDHNLTCLDMKELMGIDVYNINSMTVDGIHPSEEARNKYAGILVDTIRGMEE